MRAREVRVGIIGAGGVAARHAAAFKTTPHASLHAILGRDPTSAAAFAKRHELTSVPDMESLWAAADLVVIATPHPSHARLALAAINARKHVLIEKPMALSVEECVGIITAADAAGVVVSTVSQRRWYAAVRAVKTAINAGLLGRPVLAEASLLGWRGPEYYAQSSWRGTIHGEGGGVLVNQAIHHLDLLRWFLGPVAEVDADLRNVNHPEIEVEDTAVALIQFVSGAVATFVASNSQRPGLTGRIDVHGSNGASIGLVTDPDLAALAQGRRTAAYLDLWTASGKIPYGSAAVSEDADASAIQAHQQQATDVVQAILDGRSPTVTGRDGLATVRLLTAIQESARTGVRVRIEADA